jgi:hypothetical protein
MNVRRFSCVGLAALVFGPLVGISGCGNEAKETGGTVQTPAEDLKSMEASADAYRAAAKERKPIGK